MAKKIKKIQAVRHLVQLAFFILLPGLYAMAFSELKGIYQMILKGSISIPLAFQNSSALITAVVLTLLLGRFFCGWACAFGAYNDFIYGISRKLFKVRYRVNEKLDSRLKYIKYAILMLIVIISWTFGSTLFSTASPWDVFGQLTDLPQIISSYAAGFAFLAAITVGAAFIERFFCRYLCPLGAVFTIASRCSLFKIKMPKDKCGKCRACTSGCSMGIPLYGVNEARGGECINCLKCVEVCPRKNAAANVIGANMNPALASSVAIAALVGIYSMNQLGATAISNKEVSAASLSISSANSAVSTTSSSVQQKYKDGTYTGTGTGFRGGTTEISVTIKDGQISSISTISSQDTPDFYQRAENVIADEIISAQSTSVDTVSGATYSSNGIISAVQQALTKAEANAAAY